MAPRSQKRPTVTANTAILTGYTVFETVVVFLFTVVVARYLGTQEFGRLGFALSYALLFSVLSDPGISIAMTKLVATSDPDRQSRFVANGLALRLVLSAAVFLVSLVPFAFSPYMRQIFGLVLVIVVSELLRNLAIFLCFVFRGHQQNKYEAISMGVERVGSLVAGWILLHMGFRTFTVALVYLGARLASLLVAIAIYRSRFDWTAPHFDRGVLESIRLQTYPLAVLVICERANMYLPPILVTWFAGELATGIFQAAFKAVMPAVLLCTAVAASLYAPMAARFAIDPAESARLYRSGTRGLLHLLLPSAVLTLLLPRQIVLLLYGPEYLAAAPVLQLLTPYFVSIVFVAVNHLFLPAIEHQRVVGAVSIFSVALNVGLGLVLIEHWGATGAAWALTVAQVVVAAVYAGMAHRFGAASLSWKEWRTIAAAFAGALAAVALARPVLSDHALPALVVAGACAGVAYFGIMAFLGGISNEERNVLRLLTRRLFPRAA